MDDKKQKVIDAVKNAGKPVRAGDVAEATGLPKDEVAKALRELKKEGVLISPKVCFYAPVE